MLIYPTLKMAPIQGLTGFGGGATGNLVSGGGGLVHPFDDMGNFPNASKASTNVIYYTYAVTSGNTQSFTDPNGGASKFRFTVVGGGGATSGDGGGWYGVTGGGGGGAARGEIQTSQTLGINVGQGGGSPIISGVSGSSISGWLTSSISSMANGTNAVDGRGGLSYVQAAPNPSGHWLLYGYGGLPGAQGYHSSLANRFNAGGYSSSFNGNRSFWLNGGNAVYSPGGGVTITNATTEYGGTGGCAAHKNYYASGIADHPLDGKATYPSNSTWAATAGESTTYAGPGGGGGSDYDDDYQIGSGGASFAAGAAGGSASGLNTLLSGSGLSSAGGNGSNYSARGNAATYGTLGGGAGGNSRYSGSDSWNDNFRAAAGVVVVEFLGF